MTDYIICDNCDGFFDKKGIHNVKELNLSLCGDCYLEYRIGLANIGVDHDK